MATKKKKASKKSGTKARTVTRDAQSGSPITIGGGSMFIHFDRGDFNHSGDTDDHKNPAAKITHLSVSGAGIGKPIEKDITKLITVVVTYE